MLITKNIEYQFFRLKGKLFKEKEQKGLHRFFRRQGVKLEKNCRIYSNIVTSEPYLLSIGDNVTISSEVLFLTHDNSVCKCEKNATDIFGKIKIGSNCFIGARSTLLYGVTLADSIIVAAGSVVTRSFVEEGIIIDGVPAKKMVM